jgi:hypothetical protein
MVILAKNTAQIASTDKNCAGTTFPCNRFFFSKMQISGGNTQFGAFSAETFFPGKTVNTTSPRAKFAMPVKISNEQWVPSPVFYLPI